MLLKMLKAKIHGATVTMTDLHYEGSIEIDSVLLEAAGILPYEHVDIWNITNGQRLATYVIEGRAGSGAIMLNGAAARLAETGDRIIIAAFGFIPAEDAAEFDPKIVLIGDENKVASVKAGSFSSLG